MKFFLRIVTSIAIGAFLHPAFALRIKNNLAQELRKHRLHAQSHDTETRVADDSSNSRVGLHKATHKRKSTHRKNGSIKKQWDVIEVLKWLWPLVFYAFVPAIFVSMSGYFTTWAYLQQALWTQNGAGQKGEIPEWAFVDCNDSNDPACAQAPEGTDGAKRYVSKNQAGDFAFYD